MEIFIYSPLSFIFLGLVFIQVFFFLFFFLRLALYQNKPVPSVNQSEPVSIIVCVLNEMEYIQKLLPALLNQKYPQFEVIVVSDRSPDELYDWLLFESFHHKNMKLIRVNQLYDHITPKKFALTLGIKSAKYEQILLTDADCMPASENWITEMQQGFANDKSLVLGVSQYNFSKGLLNFIIRHETFYTAVHYLSFALAGVPYMGVGRNLAYRKSLFFKNKGFHSHYKIMGGDDDLFVREIASKKNTAICINQAGQTFSEPKKNWQQWYIQKRRHLSVGKYYKNIHKILLSSISFSQAGFWVVFLLILLLQQWSILFFAGFFVRNLVFLTVQQANIRRIGANIKWYGLPVFDVFYVFYYVIIGFSAVFAKKIRWH